MPLHLAILNQSTTPGLTGALLSRIRTALQHQLSEHYAPQWQCLPPLLDVAEDITHIGPNTIPIVILDNADVADALGYHDVTPTGLPYARVFTQPILSNGGALDFSSNSVSVTLSHEILETVGDRYAHFWSDGPQGLEYALELCDAVEGDSYTIGGVAVSNFVLPQFFRDGPGPFDYLGKLGMPFQMTSGGYQIVRSGGTDTKQIFGSEYPEWRKAGKNHAASRSHKRGAFREKDRQG
jgi:hypothetical protein